MKINIDTPCHENWDAMTPNDKGAFCLSCQKTVVDFSTKTIGEIKSFFSELPLTEKVCGRFANTQLEEMSFDHFFKRFKKWNLLHKVAVVCFFTFGLALFSCSSTENHLVGEVDSRRDTLQTEQYTAISPTDTPMTMGQPIAPIDTAKKHPIKKIPAAIEKPVKMIKGDVMVEPDPVRTTQGGVSLTIDDQQRATSCGPKDTIKEKEPGEIMGKIKLHP